MEVSDMSLIKCPKCGEMFSDSYKTCPFCEEDEAYYSGKLRKHKGRRAAESSRRKTPSIVGPVVVLVLILLAALVVWLIFGDRIKDAVGGEKPPITDVDTPDDTVTTPDDTPVVPTISLNRTVLVLNVGDKDDLKVNGTEDAAAWRHRLRRGHGSRQGQRRDHRYGERRVRHLHRYGEGRERRSQRQHHHEA